MAASTGAQPHRALAPRIPRLQIGSAGTWAPGSEWLKRGARLSPEPAVSGVLTQSRSDYFSHIATVSLQRGCSGFVKVGARASEPHIRRPLKSTGLRLVSIRGEKCRKQVTYPCLLGVHLEIWGCVRGSVVRPGHQLGDLRLSPAGCKEHPCRLTSLWSCRRPLAPWKALLDSHFPG